MEEALLYFTCFENFYSMSIEVSMQPQTISDQKISRKSFAATNTLKGIAIAVVVMNHFVNRNVSGDLEGFANTWVVIFFFLSGYGIFHSVRARNLAHGSFREKLRYVCTKVGKIFPLYVLAVTIQLALMGHRISMATLLGIVTPGHFWFIPKIVQCYVLAPFIVSSVQKKTGIILIGALALSGAVFKGIDFFMAENFLNMLRKGGLLYKGIFGLHILLFILGMRWAAVAEKKKILHFCSKHQNAVFYQLVITTAAIQIAGKFSNLPVASSMLFKWFPVAALIILCVYGTTFSISNALFAFVGRISLSIYLFHIILFVVIDKLSSSLHINKYLLYGIAAPAFVFICDGFRRLAVALKAKRRTGDNGLQACRGTHSEKERIGNGLQMSAKN